MGAYARDRPPVTVSAAVARARQGRSPGVRVGAERAPPRTAAVQVHTLLGGAAEEIAAGKKIRRRPEAAGNARLFSCLFTALGTKAQLHEKAELANEVQKNVDAF